MSRFTKSKTKRNCKHHDQRTLVISTSFTCETTVTVCVDCKKQLDKPITDCR